MEDIIKEKTSADHLLYVSMKYTKTCDVIMNLILRWRKLIETSIDATLEHAVENKKIDEVPLNPIQKIDKFKKLFEDNENFMETIETLMMFRKIDDLRKERIGEFRKNVCLKIMYRGEEIQVNLEKLKEYAEMLEKFISGIKQYLLS